MDKELIKSTLNKMDITCDVFVFEETESTNTTAKGFAREGMSENTVILADSQTGGRGRLGRKFFSPDGTGLYLSIIIRPKFKYNDAFLITPAVAVAVAKVLREHYQLDARIKWVNDIYINDKKVCGILTESSFDKNGNTEWAVIGIGINLCPPKDGYPKELSEIAGALFEVAPVREIFASEIIAEVILTCRSLPSRSFIDSYRSLSYLTGKTVTLPSGEEVKVIGIDDSCGLVIEYPDKRIKSLITSEVSVKLLKSTSD